MATSFRPAPARNFFSNCVNSAASGAGGFSAPTAQTSMTRDAATNLSFTIASYSEWACQGKAPVSGGAGIARMRPIHQRIAIADVDARDPNRNHVSGNRLGAGMAMDAANLEN